MPAMWPPPAAACVTRAAGARTDACGGFVATSAARPSAASSAVSSTWESTRPLAPPLAAVFGRHGKQDAASDSLLAAARPLPSRALDAVASSIDASSRIVSLVGDEKAPLLLRACGGKKNGCRKACSADRRLAGLTCSMPCSRSSPRLSICGTTVRQSRATNRGNCDQPGHRSSLGSRHDSTDGTPVSLHAWAMQRCSWNE